MDVALNARCAQGHAYTPENTYRRTDGRGRGCRICRSAAQQRYKARKIAAEAARRADEEARRKELIDGFDEFVEKFTPFELTPWQRSLAHRYLGGEPIFMTHGRKRKHPYLRQAIEMFESKKEAA